MVSLMKSSLSAAKTFSGKVEKAMREPAPKKVFLRNSRLFHFFNSSIFLYFNCISFFIFFLHIFYDYITKFFFKHNLFLCVRKETHIVSSTRQVIGCNNPI